jgi:hypothetical protein
LQYAVYDANQNILNTFTVTDGVINGSTTVEFQLTTGNTYYVLFWAAAPNATYYTVDLAAKTLEVDYNGAVSSDENRDAFYYYSDPFTVSTGMAPIAAELRRPFAQLNIGTNDYAASTSAGYTVTEAKVSTYAYTSLNFATGDVANKVAVLFDYAPIPTTQTFPVAGNEYMAMNYLLMAKTKETVDVAFTYTNGAVEKTRTVGSVPVQRNYRTNLYGQLLTSDVAANVVINPEYIDSHEAALQMAAAFGGEVTLTENVVLTTPLEITSDMVINLDGYTISGAYSKNEGHVIKNNGTLKIVGGTVSSTGANGGSAIANYGTLVVEGTAINGSSIRENGCWPSYPINNYGDMTLKDVTIAGYQGAIACSDAGTTTLENCTINKEYLDTSSHVFYINHADANVIVNSGTYTHKGMDGSLAYVIKGSITVNGGTFSASNGGYGMAPLTGGKVFINGGSFKTGLLGWGGLISIAGGDFTNAPNAAWIADGYKTVVKDGVYYVIANDTELVSSSAQFNDALSAGQKVLLASDVNISKIDLTAVSNDVVIDGNGYSITTASSYGVEVTAGKNITLKNAEVVITVDGNYINYSAGFKIANGDYAGKTIKLENCEIRMANTDWAYAVNMPAGVKNLNLVIDGCTLEGAVAFQCWGDNNTITATNSHFICNYTTSAMYTSYCVALQGDGTNNSENNTLNISGCEFSYSGVDNFNSPIKAVYNSSNAINNTITVVDCTYDNKVIAY